MAEQIQEDLRISNECLRKLSDNWHSAVVHENWVSSVRQKLPLFNTTAYSSLSPCDVNLLLAPSSTRLAKPWQRVLIHSIPKSEITVQSLVEDPLCETFDEDRLAGIFTSVNHTLLDSQHKGARAKYNKAVQITTQPVTLAVTLNSYDNIIRQTLTRLYQCSIHGLSSLNGHTDKPTTATVFPGLSPVYGLLESRNAFYIIHPFVQYSLWDTVVFSPAKLSGSQSKVLFVIYQMVKCIQHCHEIGISVGDLTLRDFAVDDSLWVYILPPNLERIQRNVAVDDTEQKQSSAGFKSSGSAVKNPEASGSQTECDQLALENLPSIVRDWVECKISNYDYLMVLNRLAGRRHSDPNHHPVLPWVTDFSSKHGVLRDLTKSKYRLTKGDRQLDLTFDTNDRESMMDALSIPHHVSDFLSDITYYVYKARQTPKEVLCKFVRSRWVPNEYPNSLQRLQEWTPDECIPEFYNDPTIFKSIHKDLGDLELPQWSDSVEDFLRTHRELLEGAQVSTQLHHWIDLTFGYKLSGPAAVKAKNVCLQLVNGHTELTNHGMVQLFNYPHPNRLSYVSLSPSLKVPDGPKRGEIKKESSTASLKDHKERIKLLEGYDPLIALDLVEGMFKFSLSAAKTPPPDHHAQNGTILPLKTGLLQRDMQALGCMIVELVLSSRMRGIGFEASLPSRYLLARKIALECLNEIPRPLQYAVRVLLNLDHEYLPSASKDYLGPLFVYPSMSGDGLPPPSASLLLHPATSIITFPLYMSQLYQVISKTKVILTNIADVDAIETNVVDRILKTKRLGKQLVGVWELYLHQHATELTSSSLDLALPFVLSLFENPVTGAQAAWSLFQPLAKLFGKTLSQKHLLPRLVDLFTNEDTTPKYLKLYHRTFGIQLIVRLGLKTYLDNFSTLLIEASAGYKNFSEDDYIEKQISVESDRVLGIYGNSQSPGVGRSASLEVVEDVKGAFDEDDVFENDILFDGAGNQSDYGPAGYQKVGDVSYAEDALGCDLDDPYVNEDQNEEDDEAYGENDGNELGKSVGRLSVHSMSRFMEADRLSASSEQTGGSSTDEDSSATKPPSDLMSPSNEINESETVPKPQLSGEEVPMSKLTPFMMVRSDTAEFGGGALDTSGGSIEYNIGEVASETIKWLAYRLGPVLTAKYLTRNLLRMLALCYQGSEQQQYISEVGSEGEDATSRGLTRCPVLGDDRAVQVLDCLVFITTLYGEHLILLQYFAHAKELISSAGRKLSSRSEGGLISCAKLLLHMIPNISDNTLMDLLNDTVFRDMILPLIRSVSSQHVHFPGAALARGVLCNKILDVLYLISLRIGFEMTRQHMTFVLQKFFAAFSRVYSEPRDKNGTDDDMHRNHAETKCTDLTGADIFCAVKLDPSSNQYDIADADFPHHGSVPNKRDQEFAKQHSLNSPIPAEEKSDCRSPTSPSQEEILCELRQTFTAELAHTAYIMFCKLAGGIHMEQTLVNDDLIRWLCSEHDQAMNQQQRPASMTLLSDESTESLASYEDQFSPTEDHSVVSGSFGRNVSVAGNKIVIQDSTEKNESHPNVLALHPAAARRKSAECSIDPSKIRSQDMKMNRQRHLRGNWLAYWEHEVGLADSASDLNFKQIKLQTCLGHSSSVRSMVSLDNENSFLSASKDKTVRLWSLRSIGDGNARIGSQWTYRKHRRSVFAVSFLEQSRLVASCDGSIHVWDPFVGMTLFQLEGSKSSLVTSLTCLPEPHNMLATTSSDSIIRFVDPRTGNYSHEFRCSTTPAGQIRNISVCPDGRWIVVGYSTGVLSTLDVRTGLLMASWKGHEGEILQVKAFNDKQFVTSSIDQTMCLWNAGDAKLASSLKGLTEPVHCLSIYHDGVVWGSTANRVGVHSSIGSQRSSRNISKLRTEVFRGVLTTLEVLPLNHLLVLGSDTGQITLLA